MLTLLLTSRNEHTVASVGVLKMSSMKINVISRENNTTHHLTWNHLTRFALTREKTLARFFVLRLSPKDEKQKGLQN